MYPPKGLQQCVCTQESLGQDEDGGGAERGPPESPVPTFLSYNLMGLYQNSTLIFGRIEGLGQIYMWQLQQPGGVGAGEGGQGLGLWTQGGLTQFRPHSCSWCSRAASRHSASRACSYWGSRGRDPSPVICSLHSQLMSTQGQEQGFQPLWGLQCQVLAGGHTNFPPESYNLEREAGAPSDVADPPRAPEQGAGGP